MSKKCQRWCAIAIAGAIIILGVSAACIWKTRSAQPVTSSTFDFSKNKVGDVIAGLKIVSIEPVPDIQSPFGSDNFRVLFSGRTQFESTYTYQGLEIGGEPACFRPIDFNKLPHVVGETPQMGWGYCLRDLKKFHELFGKEYGDGYATVVMENFELVHAAAEVVDQADLVQLISKTK